MSFYSIYNIKDSINRWLKKYKIMIGQTVYVLGLLSMLLVFVSLAGMLISSIVFDPPSYKSCYHKFDPISCYDTCVCGWCSYPNSSINGICYYIQHDYCERGTFNITITDKCAYEKRRYDTIVISFFSMAIFFIIMSIVFACAIVIITENIQDNEEIADGTNEIITQSTDSD